MRARKKKVVPNNRRFKIKLLIKLHPLFGHNDGKRVTASDKQAQYRLDCHFGCRKRMTAKFVNKYTLHSWM